MVTQLTCGAVAIVELQNIWVPRRGERYFRIWIHVHVHISCVAVQMTLHKSSSAFQVVL